MPLDVLGRTRATLTSSESKKFLGSSSNAGACMESPWPEGLGNLLKSRRAGDRSLQL